MTIYVGIVSSGRAKNVPKMTEMVGDAVWYVGNGEGDAYRDAGAARVVESGNLMDSRNAVLEDAFAAGLAAIQLSDDLTRLRIVTDDKQATPIPFEKAVEFLKYACASTGARLAGIAPVDNPFYTDPTKPIKTEHFILGDFMYVEPSTPRFDTALRLKEDYDFTAQHLFTYGRVARCDIILGGFQHRTNAGGAVAYRDETVEQEAIATLRSKWGAAIVDNTKRENEILFRGRKVLEMREATNG
jgi:hypothetical protein